MELVYLWVEEYKNIHKQGFNFSPRFHCEYDPDTNELTIDENKDYIPDFFGENINVTAIVGKNGSGKSSLFEAFDFSWKDVYYIYYKNGHLYSNYFKKDKNNKPIINGHIIVSVDVIYMHKFFFMQMNQNGVFSSLYKENLYIKKFKSTSLRESKLNPKVFHKNILKLIFKQTYLPLKFFNPKNISIKFNITNKELDLINLFDSDINKLSTILNCPMCCYKIYLKSLELLQEYKYSDNKLIEELKEFIIQDKDKILNYDYLINEDFDIIIDERFFKFIEKCFVIKNRQIKISDFYSEYLRNDNKESYYDIFYYLFQIGFLEYEIYDENNKNFSSLSTGEKTLFTDFCLLTEQLNKEQKHKENDNEIKERIIFLDEPDLTLHPEWQKMYIDGIIFILKKYKDINFHLIVTTHSPFLLSDIPKQNIIFLDKDENGNCKVVDGLHDKQETFGQNIHTLLSDSFFMEDGLMGEFAKRKINEIIRFHNITKKNKHKTCLKKIYDKREKMFRQTQSIVGDPYLKQVLENHLLEIDKFFDKKVAKAKLKARLEKQLAELEDD